MKMKPKVNGSVWCRSSTGSELNYIFRYNCSTSLVDWNNVTLLQTQRWFVVKKEEDVETNKQRSLFEDGHGLEILRQDRTKTQQGELTIFEGVFEGLKSFVVTITCRRLRSKLLQM